jgi:phosphoribosylformylglycinamidine cyclo-ligase
MTDITEQTLADQCLSRAKTYIKGSYNDNVLSGIGNFGGLFQLDCKEYDEPVLVSSIDGVGTKLTLAVDFLKNQTIWYEYNPHFNIGVDLVNHCVNDIAVQGAKPLFFLDYFSTTKLHPSVFENLASGMSWACQQADCPIVSGEIAQMPGFYANDIYDIAGSIVGIVEKDKLITGKDIQYGDVIIGLSSSGLHTNGYSLVRSTILNNYTLNSTFNEIEGSLGESLLAPHKSYLNLINGVCKEYEIRGMAHITGGGITGNISRIIPQDLKFSIDWGAWEWPAIFKLIQDRSAPNLDEETMKDSFNLGIGMVFVVHSNYSKSIIDWLKEHFDEDAIEIGQIHEDN